MKMLIILNDPPYGTERSYNGLRLAHSLKKNAPDAEITLFLMADAVLCAKSGQKTRLWSRLQQAVPGIRLNGHPEWRLPNTLNAVSPE